MNSILITGGSGAIGQALTEHLLTSEVQRICIFSRGEFRQFEMRKKFKDNPKLRFMIGDVRDRQRLTRAMEGVDTVIHAAALKRIEVGFYDPIEMVRTNVDGAINVIEAAHDAEVKKVLALSTDKAYQPISPYGHTKALAESLFLASNNNSGAWGPKFAVTRYGNIWKSTGSVVPVWSALLKQGNSVFVTDPDCTRFFMKIEEAVDLVVNVVRTMKGGEIAIPDLPAYRLGDLAEAMGAEMNIIGLPKWEKLHENMDENRCSSEARRMTIEELRTEL